MGRIVELQELVGIESFNIWLLSNFMYEIFFSVIDILMFINLFKINVKKRKIIGVTFVDAILRMIFFMFIPVPYYRLINLLITICLFKIVFKEKIERCLFGEIVNCITILIAELILSKTFCEIFSHVDTYADGIYDLKYSLCLNYSIILYRIGLFGLLNIKQIHIDFGENINKKDRKSIVFVCIIGLIIIYFNAVEMTLYIKEFPYIVFALDVISLIIYFYISLKNIIRINLTKTQEEKIYSLETYNKTLSIMYDSIRGFRHDFFNVVQALDGYATANDIEGVKKMCKSILRDCIDINSMGILDPKIINNPAIYAILTNKYCLARKENVNINIEVMIDLQDLNIDFYELSRILGILLDNAIEAAKECEEKNVYVRFVKDSKVNRKLIIIENNYNRVNIDMVRLFDKGYTTKEDTEGKHGLGLWNVKRILAKRKNLNLYTQKGDMFYQQLEIYE